MAVAKLGSWVLGTDTLGTRVISPFVQQPGARVFTGGVERSAGSVSVVREIAATTPASLGTPGGVMAGTVTAALTEPDDVHTRKRSPWDRVDGWPPADGDLIDVDATLDGETWGRRFTGVLEGAAGAAQDIEVLVDGVDAIDRLNRPILFEPLANPMPVQAGSTSVTIINPLLRHEHYVERALRSAGWWLGPRPASSLALHLPLCGSILSGGLHGERAVASTAADTGGVWRPTAWGLGLKLTSRRLAWHMERTTTPSNDFEVQFYVQHDPEGPADQGFELRLSSSATSVSSSFTRAKVRVETTPDQIIVRTYSGKDGSQTNGRSLSIPGPWTIRIIRDGDQHGIRFNDGSVNWVTDPSPSTATGRYFRLEPNGSRDLSLIGHLIAGQVGEVHDPTPRSALLLVGDIYKDEMVAGRYLPTTIIEVLRDIAEATNAAAWIDKAGYFVWAHPDALTGQEPTATLTADADVLDMAWRHQHNDLRHQVRVSSQQPTITASDRADVEWWSGTGDLIDADQAETWWERLTIKEIASAPSSEDWFPAKLGPYILKQTTTSKNEFAKGEADWYGATTYYGKISDPVSGQEGIVQAETRKITSQAYETWTEINLSPGDQDSVSPRIPNSHFLQSSHPAMVPYNGTPLPVIRGFGKVEWAAGSSTSGNATGPVTAADYDHDPGWWVQGGDNKRLANWIAEQVTVSRPLIEDLPVVPRHDLELGDVITVEECAVYGVTIEALIIGIREQYTHGESAMTLTLRVLTAAQAPEVETGPLTLASGLSGSGYWTRYGPVTVLEVDAAGTYATGYDSISEAVPERAWPRARTPQNLPVAFGLAHTSAGAAVLYAQEPNFLGVDSLVAGVSRVYGTMCYRARGS